MKREIIKHGNEILRTICEVAQNDEKLKQVVQDLKNTLSIMPNGAGLAAPQIDENLRVFVTKNYKNNNSNKDEILVFINPIINEYSELTVPISDGCLSIPNIFTKTNRSSFIQVTYYNENFEEIKEELEGFQSVVFQHEIDHLNGILFLDLLEEEEKEKVYNVLERNSNGENLIYVNGQVIQVDIGNKREIIEN